MMIHAALDLEPFADQLRRGTLPVTKRQLARIGFHMGNELRHGVGGNRLLDRRHPVTEHGIGDRHEALERIVAGIFVHRRRHHHARAVKQQRIAVRLGGRRRLGAGIGAGAGTVVDDDGLSEPRRHVLDQQPRDHIVGRGGRERHDHPDRLARIGLRHGSGCAPREHGRDDDADQSHHGEYSLYRSDLVAFGSAVQAAKAPRLAGRTWSPRRSNTPGLVAPRSAVA